jgi:purine-binding chemotaxis protein CheW
VDALLFTIDAQRYAVPLARVAEVVHAVNVQPLPGAPAIVEGVVNVRGEILPVLALRARLGHASVAPRASEYFVLVNASRRRIILRSDTTPTIVAVGDVDSSNLESVGRALAGVLPMPDGLALFQDIDAFIAAADDHALDVALTDLPLTA